MKAERAKQKITGCRRALFMTAEWSRIVKNNSERLVLKIIYINTLKQQRASILNTQALK